MIENSPTMATKKSRYPKRKMSTKDIIEELDDSIDKLEQLLGSDSGSDKDFKYFSNSSDSDLILDSDSENHHLSSTDNKRKKKMKNYKLPKFVNLDKGKNTFTCVICAAPFGQKTEMNAHIASVHEGNKPFKCAICDTRFAENS